jgi:serine/threonine-protein kinase
MGGAGEAAMLLFDVPIRYQDKGVGTLRLGVSTAPLAAAQRTTFWVIAAVLVVTLAAMVGAAYALFRRPLALLGMLGEAMLRVARGEYGYRIRLARRDELGRLFATFNLMNSSLQARQPGETPSAPGAAADAAAQPTLVLQTDDEDRQALG